MAKVQIKSEKLTPFGGIFSIMEQFDALLAQTIDSSLGLRCTMFGYQYSEILRSLMCVYLCGGRHVLNIYSDNNTYANLFKTDFG
ncbi:putative transposase [Parabacteroides distasonis str. 3999B T(B) 4]|nr:putative transposase [Parabacteroides distasonis str. 3999B T(B) 4]